LSSKLPLARRDGKPGAEEAEEAAAAAAAAAPPSDEEEGEDEGDEDDDGNGDDDEDEDGPASTVQWCLRKAGLLLKSVATQEKEQARARADAMRA
jgi:hypothetical protein